jgi:hypothetical protein
MQHRTSPESAALGLTVGELKTFRANLAAAHDGPGMAEVMLPVLKNACRLQLPIAPPKETCDSFLK